MLLENKDRKPIITPVEKIINSINNNLNTDTSSLENQLTEMV